jgi:hypothetical protein
MYARVTLLEIDTLRADVDSTLAMFREQVVPAMHAMEGYRGAYAMVTPEGKGLVVTFWETAEDADVSADNLFYSETLESFMVMFRSPPGRERYEVVFTDEVIHTG